MGPTLALFGISVARLVSGLFSGLTAWVGDGAAAVVSAVGHLLDATTQPALGAGFILEYTTMTVIGVTLAAPFLVLALVHAIIRQDAALLVRAAFVRLPASILLAAVAVEVVRLCLSGTDELSVSLLHAAGNPARSMFGVLVLAFSNGGGPGLPFTGFAAFVFAVLATLFALVLWLELALRSAAVAAATLFLPLVLAGLVWQGTSHWARRLAETIAALVLSKLVIAGILALAVSLLGTAAAGSGIPGVVDGLALLFLASLAPFAVLRLLPMIESGAVAHLEGQARRPLHFADPSNPTRRLAGGALDRIRQSPDSPMPPTPSGIPGMPVPGSDPPPRPSAVALPTRADVEAEASRLRPHGGADCGVGDR